MAPKRPQAQRHDAPPLHLMIMDVVESYAKKFGKYPDAATNSDITTVVHTLNRTDISDDVKDSTITAILIGCENPDTKEFLIDLVDQADRKAFSESFPKQPSSEEDKILDEADETAESAQRESRKRGIPTEGMEFDAQRIIERAIAAEGVRSEEPVAHPEPDTRAELQLTAAEAAHLDVVLAELRERNMPLSTAEVEVTIAGLQEIGTRNLNTARQLGLHAVEHGLISQRKLAKLLHVSQVAVSKWLRKDATEPEAAEPHD